MFLGNGLAVFDSRSHREPLGDIVPDSPKGMEAPHTFTKRGTGSSISVQLDSTARSPSLVETKSGACANLDIADAAYVGIARCFIPSLINDRQFEPYSPILPFAYRPSP